MSDSLPPDNPRGPAEDPAHGDEAGPGSSPPRAPIEEAANAVPGHAPRHNEWTRARMAAFLRELATCQNVSQAARSVGMSRQSAYNLRNRKPGTPFALAWEVALETGLQQLAHAVMDRALNGEEVPHYYHGELVGTYRKFDNRLAAWVLDNPWKLGRQQPQRELASRDWQLLLDQVEFGDEFELPPNAEELAEWSALLTEEERERLTDPVAQLVNDNWYLRNPPGGSGRARR